MEYKIMDHIKTRASLAVLVIDDYTNRIVNDSSVLVSIEGAARPIRKSEGYHVFINLTGQTVRLTVKGERYATEIREIDLATIRVTDPTLKIRVKPNRNYPLLKGVTSLSGYAEPESEIRIICDKIQRYYRLLYDYDKEEHQKEIRIYNPDKADLDGKLFCLNNDNSELIYITNTIDRDNNIYEMDRPLENSYKKAGTKIFPVFVTKADEQGEYFVPLWNLGEDTLQCQCEMHGTIRKNVSLPLNVGNTNKLNFMDH